MVTGCNYGNMVRASLSLLLVHASLDCGCSVLALDSVFAFNIPIGSSSYCA